MNTYKNSHQERNCSPQAVKVNYGKHSAQLQYPLPTCNSCYKYFAYVWPNLFLQQGRKEAQHNSPPFLTTPFYLLDWGVLLWAIVATTFAGNVDSWPIMKWILYVLPYLSCLLWRSQNLDPILAKIVHKPQQSNTVLMSLIKTNCPKSQSFCTASNVFPKGKALNHNGLFHWKYMHKCKGIPQWLCWGKVHFAAVTSIMLDIHN